METATCVDVVQHIQLKSSGWHRLQGSNFDMSSLARVVEGDMGSPKNSGANRAISRQKVSGRFHGSLSSLCPYTFFCIYVQFNFCSIRKGAGSPGAKRGSTDLWGLWAARLIALQLGLAQRTIETNIDCRWEPLTILETRQNRDKLATKSKIELPPSRNWVCLQMRNPQIAQFLSEFPLNPKESS